MSAKKKRIRLSALTIAVPITALAISYPASHKANTNSDPLPFEKGGVFSLSSLEQDALAEQLGWQKDHNKCGGYYLEQPFNTPITSDADNSIEVTSNQSLVSQRSTSTFEGKVTATRYGQQITANKAFLYRDPETYKLSYMDMIGDVHLREPNTLIIGTRAHYDFKTKTKTLQDTVYRTLLSGHQIVGPKVPRAELETTRRINGLTAWGKADEVSQTAYRVYELYRATFTTCSPVDPTWEVKATHIVLNKNTGRGYATNARVLIRNIPVFYSPYLNFSIDRQRKSGFLFPTLGTNTNWGPYLLTPFYWNMAPNYDMTITPGLLTKRGFQLSDNFRYLTPYNFGKMDLSILPDDREFKDFQTSSEAKYSDNTDPYITAELSRLTGASDTRTGFFWRDDARFNDHWSSHVDFNYASDDYYLQDFGSGLNEISQNQLLQEGDLYYQGQNWNFTGRLQGYQTLHELSQTPVQNSYRRVPEFSLNGDYPDQAGGLEYFINTDATHFEILKTPGSTTLQPEGNRLFAQPGISLPFNTPYFYFTPRAQLSLTDYNLSQTEETQTPEGIQRAIPIFDISSGLSFNRHLNWFGEAFQQTFEPQISYTYVPYHDQSDIPIFDTILNTLTYDQIFNYNRYSGIDRIGDANQLGAGVQTRFIDQQSGFEKMRFGIGEIFYFANRRVTLCDSKTVCNDYPDNPANSYSVSPIAATLNYYVNPAWSITGNAIWSPITKQLGGSTINLHYEPVAQHIINIGYTYAFAGDIMSGLSNPTSYDNLKETMLSAAWPLSEKVSAVGLWYQDWNFHKLQNLLYGLQYDTCCWAVRAVGGRAFIGADPTNTKRLLYNKLFYIQFTLKGLGDIGKGDPTTVLNTITGYNATQFGQDT